MQGTKRPRCSADDIEEYQDAADVTSDRVSVCVAS